MTHQVRRAAGWGHILRRRRKAGGAHIRGRGLWAVTEGSKYVKGEIKVVKDD